MSDPQRSEATGGDGGTTDPSAERITVYSDYVCPFCYLGRESLAQYQNERDEPLEIDWHPYDLRAQKRGPDGEIDHSVDDGKDDEYFEQAKENVRRLQEKYDVEMDLDIATDIDSLPAQVVSHYIAQHRDYDDWLAFDRAVFDALWQEGRDIGDPEVLESLADDAAIDPGVVRSALDDAETRETVTDRFDEARRQRVTGVPTFVYDGHAARGAVPPEQLRRLVDGV